MINKRLPSQNTLTDTDSENSPTTVESESEWKKKRAYQASRLALDDGFAAAALDLDVGLGLEIGFALEVGFAFDFDTGLVFALVLETGFFASPVTA